MVKSFLIVISILGLVQIGTCLKCYSCIYAPSPIQNPLQNIFALGNSKAGPTNNCADPFDKSGIESSTCLKDMKCGKVSVLDEDDRQIMVIRDCIPDWACNNFAHCQTCEDDFCNSSSTVAPSFLILSVFGLISLKYLL